MPGVIPLQEYGIAPASFGWIYLLDRVAMVSSFCSGYIDSMKLVIAYSIELIACIIVLSTQNISIL
jgi:hypothetical protein